MSLSFEKEHFTFMDNDNQNKKRESNCAWEKVEPRCYTNDELRDPRVFLENLNNKLRASGLPEATMAPDPTEDAETSTFGVMFIRNPRREK